MSTPPENKDDELWDPERLRVVGKLFRSYGPYISPGIRIRTGVEGDPCAYRGEQSCGTVLEVHRESDGYMRFRARLDDSNDEIELDNRNISKPWEVAPDGVDDFRAHVVRVQAEEAGVAAEHGDDRHGDPVDSTVRDRHADPEFSQYRAAMTSKLDALEQQISAMEERMEERVHRLGETTASTVRALAGDLIRSSQGMDMQFATNYADRYDDALFRRAEEYRGQRTSEDRHSHQGEKVEVPMRGPSSNFVESAASD